MNRKAHLNRLTEAGHLAGIHGQPCEAPTTTELDRAAWEIGYRAGKAIRENLEAALTKVQETQTAFWDALGELEKALPSVELDSTEDFTACYDVDTLLEMEKEN